MHSSVILDDSPRSPLPDGADQVSSGSEINQSAGLTPIEATRLTNLLIIPVLEATGSISYKSLRCSLLGHWADSLGIQVPAVIKEVDQSKSALEVQSWNERMHFLARELVDIDGSNCPEVFGIPLSAVYKPAFVVGANKNRVMFLHSEVFAKAKGLVDCPENLDAYARSMIYNEYRTHGLWSLSGLRVEVASDDCFREGLRLDGLGYLSQRLYQLLDCKAPIVQFRACFPGGEQQGVFKGLLQYDPDLDMNGKDLVLPPSTLKGCTGKLELSPDTPTSLILGVLKTFSRPLKAKSSWTWLEAPSHKCVKQAEIPLAEARAHKFMDIINEPAKALEYKDLLAREDGAMSRIEQFLRIAVGAKVTDDRPSLLVHPYLALGLRDMMARRLRDLSVNGAREWNYLVGTGEITTGEADGREIRCNTHPVGTRLVVRRFPVILRDSWGVVVGPTQGDQEIQLGSKIMEELAGDVDGDQFAVISCERRLAITQKERGEEKAPAISKTKARRRSSWFETVNVICRNLGGSAIGSATLGMLSAEFSGHHDKALELSHELQLAVDQAKFDTSPDIKACRQALDEWGIPNHIVQRNNTKQYRSPTTTDFTGDALWDAVATIYKSRLEQQEVAPLAQYAHLFGVRAHGLNRSEFQELEDVYKTYTRRVREISAIEDSASRDEKMKDLFDQCRLWVASKGEDDRWLFGAWMLVHQSGSAQNRGVWLFECFGARLLGALAEVYESEELTRLKDWEAEEDTDSLDFEAWTKCPDGLRGKLIRTGLQVEIAMTAKEEAIADRVATTDEPGLISIALVNIQHSTPEELGKAVESGQVSLVEDKARRLPALGCYGLDVTIKGRKVAEVADSSVQMARSHDWRQGTVLVYQKSLKIVVPVGEIS